MAAAWLLVLLPAASLRAEVPENPVTGTVQINGGALTTASRSVLLTLAAASTEGIVYDMRFSQDEGGTWSEWEWYWTTRHFVFTPGDGARTVWALFRDEFGNESEPAVAEIELAEPPIVLPPLALAQAVPRLLVAQGGQRAFALEPYVEDPAFDRVLLQTSLGDVSLRLFPLVAPNTVANFLAYIDGGRYDNSFFHRLVRDFVLQGGGFFIAAGAGVTAVESYGPLANEFREENLRGTVAMAKVGGDPDSATCEWFFNLADNRENLDYQNGGFTVFGDVVPPGMDVVDAMAALPITDVGGAFTDLPVLQLDPGGNVSFEDLVYILAAGREADELTFALQSSPAGLGASVTGSELTCSATLDTPLGDGVVTVAVEAPDGRTFDLEVPVTVIPPDATPPAGTILIDGGASFTPDRDVDLTLDASDGEGSGVVEVRFSFDNSSWSAWQPFAAELSVTLPAGAGLRTVYAQFRDAAGNVSETVSDSITLVGPVTGTIVINGGAATTTSRSVTLTLAAESTDAPMYAMCFSEDGVNWGEWDFYNTTAAFVLRPGNGPRSVWVLFADQNWNESLPIPADIELAETPFVPPDPRLLQPLGPVLINLGGRAEFLLANVVDDPAYESVRLRLSTGDVTLRLFEARAPQTVANFLRYIDDGRYDGTFFHRSVPGFVVQGGGFSITPEGNVLDVPTYGPVQNEFGASNLRGTVAMAKVGGDPNSATSGWFFNLADNSANLDYQNGGFTVFGDVDSMAAVDAIAALVTVNAGDPFDNLPLRKFDGANIFLADLIYLDGATRQPDALTFSVSGSVPGASATISGGRLVIASTGTGVTATGALTLRATAPDGRFLDVPIAVTVDTNRAPVLDKGIAARTITCTEDKPAKIKFSAKDADKGDILTWSIPTPPTLGVLAPVLGKPGSYVYTPNRDVNGTDAFTVRVTDSQGASSTLPVTIIIKPVNDAPTAAGLDGISIPGGQASVVDFTVADVDSPIEAVQVIVPAKAGKLLPVGSIVLGGAGANRTLTLTPLAPAVTTVVKLKITLTDGQAKAKRTLYVTVDPPPPPPPPPPAPAG